MYCTCIHIYCTHMAVPRPPPPPQGLGLVINMIEHSAANREQLERISVDYHLKPTTPPLSGTEEPGPAGASSEEVKGDESMEDGRSLLKGRNTSIKALITLFLKHFYKAEGATIEVHVHEK